jgi:hypothetical protein
MIKIKALFFLAILVLYFQKFSAQETVIYDAYPYGQEAYLGGKQELYKDFHNVLTKNNYESCSNKDEEMYIKIIVKNDNKISLVKNPDTAYINQNKCTYNLIKKVLPEMRGWKSAEYKGQKLNAIYEFNVFPDDLFEDYKYGYIGISEKRTMPEFQDGGIKRFRQAFTNVFKMPEEDFFGTLNFSVSFVIDIDGSMTNIDVISIKKMPSFERNIVSAIKKIKGKWTPGKIRGIPVKTRFNLPLTFNSL